MPRGRSGRKSDYQWSAFGDVTVNSSLGNVGQFGVVGSVAQFPQTMMRVRGKVGVTLDAGAAQEAAIIVCGLTIVPSDTFVTGSAPDFNTDASSDEASWVWQGSLYVTSGAEAAVVNDGLSQSIEVDSKAMRRMKANDTLVFVHQSPAGVASDQGGTYDIYYYFHCLNGT